MSFEKNQLLPSEKIILLAHQHGLVLFKPVLLNILAAGVLGYTAWRLDNYWILLLGFAPLMLLLWKVLERRRREYVVTNHRVVRQEGVFAVTSFDSSLDKINNIFHEQSFCGRILGYGNVGLETSSEQDVTIFRFIPKPLNFKNSVVHQREVYRGASRQPAASESRQDIPRLINELAGLRDRNIISAAEFEEKKKSLLAKL